MFSSHTSVTLQEKQTRPAELPRLQLSSGFVWDVGLDSLTPALPPQGESSDSEEDEKPQQATVSYFTGLCPLCRDLLVPVSCALSSLWVSLPAGWGSLRPRSIYRACRLPCQLLASITDLPRV